MHDHPIVHIEIPSQDPQAVSHFYAELFGWQVRPLPSMQYVRFQSAEDQTGGFAEVGDSLHPKEGELLVYVKSDDIDGDLKKAEQLGGKILVPNTEIPRTGWYGVFRDPAGNRIGLFKRTGMVS